MVSSPAASHPKAFILLSFLPFLDTSRWRVRIWDTANSPRRFCPFGSFSPPVPPLCTPGKLRRFSFRFFQCVCIPDTANSLRNNRIFHGARSFFPDHTPGRSYLRRRLGVFFAAPRLPEEAWCPCSSEKPVQARNWPKRPNFFTIGLLQIGQGTSVCSTCLVTLSSFFSRLDLNGS